MRKPIYYFGACALAAAAILVWSQNTPVFSRANTASSTTLSAPQMDIFGMQRNIRGLPEERLNDMTFAFSNSK